MKDTSIIAQEIQARIQRSMTGEQRLLLAIEMSDLAHDLLVAGVRYRNPDLNEREVILEVARCSTTSHSLVSRTE